MGAPIIPYGLPNEEVAEQVQNQNNRGFRLILTDYIAIGVAISAVIFILNIQSAAFAPAQFVYPQGHFERIANPIYKNESMGMVVNLASTTFAAHEDVEAFVVLYPNDNQRNSERFRSDPTFQNLTANDKVIYRIEFEGTYCGNPPVIINDRIHACYFDLIYQSESNSWHGNKTMKYSVGGDFDVFLYQKGSSNVYEQGFYSKVGTGFIQISSIDATNSFKAAENTFETWKWTVTFTIAGVLIGSLALYQRVRETLRTMLEDES